MITTDPATLGQVRCALCGDTQWKTVTTAPGQADSVVRCDCRTGRRSISGAPLKYSGLTWDRWRVRSGNEHFQAALDRWRAGQHDAYICGPTGSGKTHAACTMAQERLDAGDTVVFRDVAALLRDVQRLEFLQTADNPVDDLLHAALTCDLLVLDDVGSEKTSDFSRRTLVMLYNARVDAGRRTIWTSNLDLFRLSEAYGDDRLTSRIGGAADIIELSAADYRVTGPKEWR